jgi:hypothetical protein
LSKPSNQHYIFKNNYKTVRVFTPYQDAITKICGTDIKPNNSILEIGFTDISFTSNCIVRTTQLTIMSPILPEDNTDITISQTLPNLDKAIQTLEQLITVHTALNISQLSQDFHTLSKNIDIEKIDLLNVKTELDKTKAINVIKNFNPVEIKIDDLHPLSTTVTIISWTMILLFTAIILIGCRLCFPIAFVKFFTLLGKGLYSLTCCVLTAICFAMRQQHHNISQPTNTPDTPMVNLTSSPNEQQEHETSTFLNNPLSTPQKHIYFDIQPPTAPKPPKRLNPPVPETPHHYHKTTFTTHTQEPSTADILYAANPDLLPIINSLSSINTDTHWYIWRQNDRLRLVRRNKKQIIIYNSVTRQCVNLQGQPLACNLFPTPNDLIQYKNAVRAASPPGTFLHEGVQFLSEKPNYFFDENTKTYRDSNNDILDGYKPPMPI